MRITFYSLVRRGVYPLQHIKRDVEGKIYKTHFLV